MSHTRAIAATVVAAALAGGGAVLSGGSSTAQGPDHGDYGWSAADRSGQRDVAQLRRQAARDDATVYVFAEKVLAEEFVDVGEPGDSAGDMYVLEENLKHRRTGDVQGKLSVTCQFRITTYACSGTARLYGKGKLEVSGAFFADESVLPITGGTQAFREAGGELQLAEDDRGYFLIFYVTD